MCREKLGYVLLAVLVAAASGAFSQDATPHVQEQALVKTTICAIQKDPVAFQGRTVEVRGTRTGGWESGGLESGGCYLYPRFAEESLESEEGRQYDKLANAHFEGLPGCADCWKYAVTATFVGKIETVYHRDEHGEPVRDDYEGFGHLNEAPTQIVVTSISNVKSRERRWPRPN